ncbi:DUF551 domain-containing protein [Erwinia sp. HDF1-3R]|uniref:DUF551 domain-containing protein n=1 Tax=Erwinia sp. HDF1-3R TaxID=3141543 RepID=UPI0031F52CD0
MTNPIVTLSRERLEQLADENTICKVSWDERIEMARALLAVMDAQDKPFMFGIADYDGKPHFDEVCVDADGGLLADVVDSLNDFREEGDAGYSVVPLYTTPPAPSAPDGWIKCSDRMPECGEWDHAAVMASEGSNSFVAYYNKHECRFLNEPFGESLGNKITHWMPLPLAPSGE